MNKSKKETIALLKIRKTLLLFIIFLVLSGLTAFPLQTELNFLLKIVGESQQNGILYKWLFHVNSAINYINLNFPFLSYGTDWLAFAHIIISIFFVGVYQDPIKNIWITKTGIIACILIFPLAFIAGHVRGIPLFWQLIDCSFGVFGLIPLVLIYKWTKQINNYNYNNDAKLRAV